MGWGIPDKQIPSRKINGTEIQLQTACGPFSDPLLFITYINGLNEYIQFCKLSLHADDTVLYTSGKSQVEIMLNFRMELSIIDLWMTAKN